MKSLSIRLLFGGESRLAKVLWGAVVILLGVQLAGAQVTASVSGRVEDASGAAVPGTTVTVRNLETGTSRLVSSDDAGRYRALSLPVGHYEVKAEREGFKTAVRTGINLVVGQEAVVNLRLEVGEVVQEVTVTGEAPIVNTTTGDVIPVELFVAVLGASNYTFAEATPTQQSADWILSHSHAVEYFGGVPTACVPDQLRTGVTVPCRYEPGVQRTYADWAQHYHTIIIPARPAKPRDKAKAEVGVQIAERWILARLRHETFFSLDALNARIRELLTALNTRPMKTYGGVSRRDLFERYDRPALQPLPAERFVYGDWLKARVNIDYHVQVDHHYYSVPYPLIHAVLDVRLSATTVEIFQRGTRVWLHARSAVPGRHTTVAEHMPKAHRAHLEWSPSRLLRWGATIGAATEALVQQILESRPHPEQGYRSCLGLLRLAKQYGPERLNAACERARRAGARSYRHVDAMLKHGLDRQPLLIDSVEAPSALTHDNVRGPAYYHEGEPS